MLIPGDRSHNTARRSGSGYGSGFNSSALTMLKMAVFAPMPMPSDAVITNVAPAWRRQERSAYRRSCRKVSMVWSANLQPNARSEDGDEDRRHEDAGRDPRDAALDDSLAWLSSFPIGGPSGRRRFARARAFGAWPAF